MTTEQTQEELMEFGDELKKEYDSEDVYLTFDAENRARLSLDIIQRGKGSMKYREFPDKKRGGKYKRVAILLKEKTPDGKDKWLILPIIVYTGLRENMKEYKDKLKGVTIKKSGSGTDTKYALFPQTE